MSMSQQKFWSLFVEIYFDGNVVDSYLFEYKFLPKKRLGVM